MMYDDMGWDEATAAEPNNTVSYMYRNYIIITACMS